MALGETSYGLLQSRGLHLAHHLPRGIGGALVLDEVAELRGALLRTQGLVEARGVGHGALDIAHVLDRPSETPGDLLIGRLALQLGQELAVHARHLADLVSHVYRNPYGAPLVGHGPLDRLPYPPRSIGREAEAPVGVELLYGLHEP